MNPKFFALLPLASLLLGACTSVKSDDHSYTYVYQHQTQQPREVTETVTTKTTRVRNYLPRNAAESRDTQPAASGTENRGSEATDSEIIENLRSDPFAPARSPSSSYQQPEGDGSSFSEIPVPVALPDVPDEFFTPVAVSIPQPVYQPGVFAFFSRYLRPPQPLVWRGSVRPSASRSGCRPSVLPVGGCVLPTTLRRTPSEFSCRSVFYVSPREYRVAPRGTPRDRAKSAGSCLSIAPVQAPSVRPQNSLNPTGRINTCRSVAVTGGGQHWPALAAAPIQRR